jgi:hypothetical protein
MWLRCQPPSILHQLRQIAFAADIFLRLKLGHAQEMAEHLKAMAMRKLHQFRGGFCNKVGGLFGPAVAVRLMFLRRKILSCGAFSAALCLGQASSESECL